ncbi:VanW family protein [Candidatus Uhrbacteria bacterium]|nr:VanW family protein [Candidatus Uhrbacteria bacterium]
MKPTFWIVSSVIVVAIAGASVFLFSGRILPSVQVGSVPVGGLTAAQARQAVETRTNTVLQEGATITVDGASYPIALESVGYAVDVDTSVAQAVGVGRSGTLAQRVRGVVAAMAGGVTVDPLVKVNRDAVVSVIDAIALRVDYPLRDVRLVVNAGNVEVATDTQPGRAIDREALLEQVTRLLQQIESPRLNIETIVQEPVIDLGSVSAALEGARSMIGRPLQIKSTIPEHEGIVIAPEQIGSWLASGSRDRQLVAEVDRQVVSQYVARLASGLTVEPREPKLVIEGKKVIEFEPPVAGRVLDQERAIADIIAALELRRDVPAAPSDDAVSLDIQIAKPTGFNAQAQASGIRELIGRAVTSFAGSPPNRISNIKNGVKFLNGLLIAPGEEFSTIKALGRIDNTTGYLPELVIKQNRTIPEFGGGLCQVSTTLFRAVMNAGLPITARQNHSYRVSYYEKDGDGNTIGPGLDATIYSPNPDFRFVNDTGSPMLLHGYVSGTRVVFEFYGTTDGRTSTIEGPTTLTTSPAGPAIRIPTETLPEGKVKQIERAHPGGSAVATYTINYPDGRVETKVFKSFYCPWPEQFLVGVPKPPAAPEAAPSESIPAVDSPTP